MTFRAADLARQYMPWCHVLTVEKRQAVHSFQEADVLLMKQSSPLKRSTCRIQLTQLLLTLAPQQNRCNFSSSCEHTVQCLTTGTVTIFCSHGIAVDHILDLATHAAGFVLYLEVFVVFCG